VGKAGKNELVRKENGFRYRRQFGVVVLCDDEKQYRRAYKELTARGYKCKIVCV
jgi:hypothetical protein